MDTKYHSHKQLSRLYFFLPLFNCCFSVVLSFDKGAYPENAHVLLCHIKLQVFLLTAHVFGQSSLYISYCTGQSSVLYSSLQYCTVIGGLLYCLCWSK